MSTETMRTIRDGEPKKAGSTLTQLLNSAHTKGPFKFSVALHPQIERSRVRIPAGTAGEFSSPGSTFCADSYFGIRSTPVLPQ